MNKIRSTTVYLTRSLKENGLRIEWFHRGRFLIRRRFKEIAFCSKDSFKVDGIHNGEAAYPEGGIFMPRRAVMERTISIRRAVFRRTVLIQRAVVERAVQKMVSYIAQIHFCLNQNDIRTAYVRHETASQGFMYKEHKEEAFSPIKL